MDDRISRAGVLGLLYEHLRLIEMEEQAQLLHEVLHEVQTIPALPDETWISTEDRLPENGTRALVMRFDYVTNTPFYDLLWLDKGEWWNRRDTGDYAVTHWMPLPEPPKEV